MKTWLVSARFDLAVFLGPAVAALVLLALEPLVAPDGFTPVPIWILTVVFVDVAHVWSTIYRTYLDPRELRRRPWRYVLAPVCLWIAGVSLYSMGSLWFWRALAYFAVFHFVRQQFGWVALYGRKAGDGLLDRRIDAAAVYLATIWPIVYWHVHLPRSFEWFLPGDFIHGIVSPAMVAILGWTYAIALLVFVGRQIHRFVTEEVVAWGKIVVVSTTALCWGLGIVVTNTDYAFTVTNVLIHGVPYVAVVWLYGRKQTHPGGSILARIFGEGRWFGFIVSLAAVAYFEEALWDRLVWHEHGGFFVGPEVSLSSWIERLVVPLLALPQATHYLVDAWIWKTSPAKNPELPPTLGLGVAS
ncbi:MAG: hypothetical protein HY791_19855 [Deltaproteobacteria bacterium]|nr:hypothetical protein [Deltaproteobacteria bacterium]